MSYSVSQWIYEDLWKDWIYVSGILFSSWTNALKKPRRSPILADSLQSCTNCVQVICIVFLFLIQWWDVECLPAPGRPLWSVRWSTEWQCLCECVWRRKSSHLWHSTAGHWWWVSGSDHIDFIHSFIHSFRELI